MCRLLAYKGPSVLLNDLLYKPKHSLIKQSYHATETDEPLNGDGFGIGWYARAIESSPAIFKSIQPAWNNQNLQHIAPKITSDCLFAHVRAASVGGVNQQNCHPFSYNDWMMMHNGGIESFSEIRRPLLEKLSDEAFHLIEGQTDSEHIFALFIANLSKRSSQDSLITCQDALRATVEDLSHLIQKYIPKEGAQLNLLFTNGLLLVGSRLVIGTEKQQLSLHYARDPQFEYREHAGNSSPVLIVSERLNEHARAWETVPANHYFTVDNSGALSFIEA